MSAVSPPAPVATTVVVADELRKTYSISRPPRDVLRGVSLQVTRGEFVALMGPSGCGKSTLLHILGGLEPPDAGAVSVEGRSLYNLDDGALSAFRRDRIGFVFQFFNLLPNLTAAENVALPLRLRNESSRRHRDGRVSNADISDRVALLMDQLNLHGLQGHGPEEISGGEQQRVAIARALAAAPALLLADEPTGNLDWTTGHEVMALLGRLCRSQQQTTVLVTHDARVAAHADRVLVMRDGQIVDEVALTQGTETGAPAAVGVLVDRLGKLDL
ncbi:MAG: ABC transporter ATP-binding protein [Candidatus Dormibacteraeota bacterium]|nr:ABC transporter ATP-binding protein [Candidatus Dormibacteraeota bacterium]